MSKPGPNEIEIKKLHKTFKNSILLFHAKMNKRQIFLSDVWI